MIQKYDIKNIVVIAIALAFVMPVVAFVHGETMRSSLNTKSSIVTSYEYHEGWPQILTGDENMWGGIISPVVTDLDKDGFKEMIVTQQGEPSRLYVFEQNGSLKFDVIEMPESSPYIDPRRFPSIGDIDNDGFKEIIIVSDNEIMIYNHTGFLLHEWEMDYAVSDDLYSSIVLADINLDSNLELIYGGWWTTGSRLVVLDNEGNDIPGFPVMLENIQMSNTNTPAVGNFDDDPDLEIVVISHENNQPVDLSNIRAYKNNGSLLWAQEIDSILHNDPSVGDLNHDGFDEVVFTSEKGIHVLDRYGNYLVNKSLGYDADSSNIALADLNDDKNLEVIFGYDTSIYAMNYEGTILWSYNTGWNAHYPPVVGDITGDDSPDIVTNSDTKVLAWNSQGALLDGFPLSIESNAYGACSVADIDNNGEIELIASSDWSWNGNYNEGYIYVWDLFAVYNSVTMHWPMFQHDPQHTGMYPHSLVADADGPYESVTGELVQFFGSASGGSPSYSWWWDFGDGNTSDVQNPTHAYDVVGVYKVTLAVTDTLSDTATDDTIATIIAPAPEIEIGAITGGLFKVKAVIKNSGDADATDVDWSITLDGGLIILGKETTGTETTIAAGDEVEVFSSLILGFGKTTITVIADTATKDQAATVLLIYIKL